jgi:hypothetical protein
MTDLRAFYAGTAELSPCGTYRYLLTRNLGVGSSGLCNFVMLNPSTADADQDDPTIRRCMRFAQSWGCSELAVTNLFAYRATLPSVLRDAVRLGLNPEGPQNNHFIHETAARAAVVVCAWGAAGSLLGRSDAVRSVLLAAGAEPQVLRLTKHGQPCHPLYLPGRLRPQAWNWR